MTQSVSLASRIFDSKKATEPMISYSSFKPPFVFERHGTHLERVTPEEMGISSRHLEQFIKTIASDKTLNMHDLLVIRNGKLLCEVSFGAQRSDIWKHTFSACKSITALAVGMLVDDGVLSLEEKVIPIFSGDVGPIAKLRLKDLAIEDLLTMRSSVMFAEVDSATDNKWKKEFFNSSVAGEIGETFKYNSINTYILSAIVCKKTGKSLSEFLDERLFAPLGIVDYYWERSPEEIEKGGWGLYIYPEDIAKIGIMVMDRGIWNGKRIISEEYLEKAASTQVMVNDEECLFNYGYQIWVGRETDSFLFNGMLGQNVFGFRRNGVILVTHAGNGEFFQSSNYFRYAKEFFNRDFETILPKDRVGYKILQKTANSLSLYHDKSFFRDLFDLRLKKTKKNFAPLAGEYIVQKGDVASVGVVPLTLQMVQSDFTKGLLKIELLLENGEPSLRYIENGGEYTFRLGFDKPQIGNYTFGNNNFTVGCSAYLKTNEEDLWVLTVRFDFMETPFSRIVKFTFDGDDMFMRQTEMPGEDFVAELAENTLKDIVEKPLVSTIFEKIGDDYIAWKLKKAYSPEIVFQKKKQ